MEAEIISEEGFEYIERGEGEPIIVLHGLFGALSNFEDVAGSHDFISKAWLLKRRWGGAMRQTGVLTAMCLYALDNHIDRLADDHALAQFIGVRLGKLEIISNILPIDTNIVIADIAPDGPDAREVAKQLKRKNVTITVVGPRRIRIVTHMDVGETDADALVAAMSTLI